MRTWTRRSVLKGAAVAGGLWAAPGSSVFAQSAASLLRAPKHALVIGNSKYREAPLRNPGNDARGMAAALTSAGFDVSLAVDLGQAAMRNSIAAYTDKLVKTKGVGLFYFAGHAAQLAWRNYLVPIDADIENAQQLRERTVDLNSLVEGIRRAGNLMNLIILDSCRNNPFGTRAAVEQKGLSQLDAPPGTLLAYATAPGNIAEDGSGENGLYTEHLLREIRVPEVKVEDVFKRVRLAVRRRSNGQQVPWESTSLEEDFWFLPPKQIRKLAEEEEQRAFKEESAVWEKAQQASAPAPVEDYLRRYPSGRFSELAQLKLDQLLARQGEKKVVVVAAPKNPYTKGMSRTDTQYRVGDTYTYRMLDVLTGVEQRQFSTRVTHINENQVVYSNMITDLLGNYRRWGGNLWTENQIVPVEFVVGKRWKTRFEYIPQSSPPSVVDLDVRIADREQITVPAGTFNAFRVEASGWRRGENLNIQWDWKIWYAPDAVRRPVAWQWFNRYARGRFSATDRNELVSFRQG